MAQSIPGDFPLRGVNKPYIYNVTLTSANTEYPQALPDGCCKFSFRARDPNHVIKFSFNPGQSGTTYLTLDGISYSEDFLASASITLYLQSPTAGAVVEILGWQ